MILSSSDQLVRQEASTLCIWGLEARALITMICVSEAIDYLVAVGDRMITQTARSSTATDVDRSVLIVREPHLPEDLSNF